MVQINVSSAFLLILAMYIAYFPSNIPIKRMSAFFSPVIVLMP